MTDFAAGVVVILANLTVAVTARAVGRRLFPDDPPGWQLLHALVIGLALVVGAGLALGSVGCLTPAAYLVVVVGGCLLYCCRAGGVWPAAGGRPTGWVVGWSAAGLLATAVVGAGGVGRFPSDWDALWYHIPLVDQWLRAGSLYAPDAYNWANAGNVELVGLWLVGPLSGDFLVPLANLPFAVLAAVAAYHCGRGFGLARPTAHLAAAAAVAHPVTAAQLAGFGNDLAVLALFLAAVAYGQRYAATGAVPAVALHGVCVGLLAGVKFYALGYAGVCAVFVLLSVADGRGARAVARWAAAVAAGSLALGGYWYVRNLVATGTPIYPKDLFAVGPDLFAQTYGGDPWLSTLLGNRSPELPRLASAALWRMMGPAHWLAVVVAPAVLLRLVLTRGPAGRPRWALAGLLAGAGLVLAVTPNAVEDTVGTLNAIGHGYHPARFGLCFFALAVIGLAVVVEDLGRLAGPAGMTAAVASQGWHLATASNTHDWREVGLLWVQLAGLAGLWVAAGRSPAAGRLRVAYLALAVGLGGWGVQHLADAWHAGFARHYDREFRTTVFSELEAAGGDRVIGFHGYRAYPFFGSRRQFRVCHPWVCAPTAGGLEGFFRSRDVSLVAVRKHPEPSPGHEYFWSFDGCLQQSPGRYTPAWDAAEFRVFAVR